MPNLLENVGDRFGVDLDIDTRHGKGVFKALLGLSLATALLTVVLTPVKALALVATAVIIMLAFTRPEAVIVFLALYTPFEPFLLKFVPDDAYVYARYFSEGLIYVLVAVVLSRAFIGRLKLHGTPLDLPFIAFVLVALTSLAINAVPPVIGALGLRQIIRYILLFFVVTQLQPSKSYIRNLTIAMFAVVVFQGLLGLAQGIIGAPLDEFLIPSEVKFYESIQLTSGTEQFWSPGSRVFATMGRYDQLGTFLCFFFLIIVGLLYFVNDRRKQRVLGLMLMLAIPAFIMTLSRASWFGFIFGVIAVGIVLMRDRRLTLAVGAFAVALLVYAGFSSVVVRYLVDYPEQTALERVLEVFSYERYRGEFYGLGRVFWIVQTPLLVVRSAPLFGVGPGQYGGGAAAALGNTTVYERLGLPFGVYGSEGYIDNNWFSLWGETGTIGLLFYLAMFAMLAHVALKTWRESHDPLTRGLALGYLGCLVAVTFQSFLATYLEVRTLALYLWLYGAFVCVLARREKIHP
jgi:hypothetical protein